MDPQRRAFYRLAFRNALLEMKGKAFEGWFARLAGFALGPDFERVRPYGAQGDWKADARSVNDQTIYQCYAPETMREDRVVAKIEADFAGAVENWANWMKRWVFVHNDARGLPPRVLERLDLLRSRHRLLKIEVWSEAELTALADRMELAGWESLFGVVPSRHDIEGVAPDHVAEVVRSLEQIEPTPGEEPIRRPPVDKIARNALSESVMALLRAGKRKDPLVKQIIETHHRPDSGERIAEAFRARYRALKETEESPDDIFLGLQRYIGVGGSPKHQVAALAVLSYLFDRCDIFEDPDAP